MGWTFCTGRGLGGLKHEKHYLSCDICDHCPKCTPRAMEAVSDGFGPIYYVCKEHNFRPEPKNDEAYTIDVGCYQSVEALYRNIDAKRRDRPTPPIVGEEYRTHGLTAKWNDIAGTVVKVKRTRAILYAPLYGQNLDIPFDCLEAVSVWAEPRGWCRLTDAECWHCAQWGLHGDGCNVAMYQ